MQESNKPAGNDEIDKKAGKPVPAQDVPKQPPAGNENSNPGNDPNDVGSTGDYSR